MRPTQVQERITVRPKYEYKMSNISVGKGSFGEVTRATSATGVEVAIKKVLQDPRYKNREFQIMSSLNHPNLVKLLDYYMLQRDGDSNPNQNGKFLCLIMEYIPFTLHRMIKSWAPQRLPSKLVKLYMYQICRGLLGLHSVGVSHRDIKPQNILVNDITNELKLCDFGSAKNLVPGEPSIAYICSRYYRAPELILGHDQYTSAIDVWSIGCVMGEMLLGVPIFPGETSVDQFVQIICWMGNPTKEEFQAMRPAADTCFQLPHVPRLKFDTHIVAHPNDISDRQLQQANQIALEQALHPSGAPAAGFQVAPVHVRQETKDFLKALLNYDPKKRLTAAQALAHPYFDELRADPNVQFPLLQSVNPNATPQGAPRHPDPTKMESPAPNTLFKISYSELEFMDRAHRERVIPEWCAAEVREMHVRELEQRREAMQQQAQMLQQQQAQQLQQQQQQAQQQQAQR